MHLAPLALAANILQSAWSGLHHVSLTWGTLYLRFLKFPQEPGADSDEAEICQVVRDGLNKRWLDSDQDVLIAAVVLNPATWSAPLKNFVLAELVNLLARLWLRLFSAGTLPSGFLAEAHDYLLSSGKYESMATFAMDL